MKYLSLFSGVGGFELGIGDRAECIGFSEIDQFANQVLKYRFPKVKNYGDITTITTKELPDFDLLVGGFPCQSFSVAGKRMGFQDTRGTLFFDICRIIKDKKPKILLLENVKGLLSHDNQRTFETILCSLSELGYDLQWQVLNSKDFGVPQNRERVFIIGHIRKEPRPQVFPIRRQSNENSTIGKSAKATVARTLTGGGHTGGNHSGMTILHNVYGGFNEGIRESKDYSPTIRTPKGGGHLPMVKVSRQPLRFLNRNQKNMKGDYAFALDAGQTNGVKEGTRIRRLTPVECERLQGFEDNWTKYGIDDKGNKVELSDSQRFKQMGNAVTTNVISAIIDKVIKNNNGLTR